METHSWFISYLRDRDQTRDSDTIERWFALLLRKGYALHADKAARVYHADYAPSAGVSDELRALLRRYLAGEAERFSFALTREPLATTFDCSLHPNEGILFLSASDQNFNDRYTQGYGADCYSYWLELVEQCYSLWHPIYGFEIGDMTVEHFTERDDALALNVQHLYTSGNLFGPELVKKLGRNRLDTAPADYRRTLDDGGVLLVPVALRDLPLAGGEGGVEAPVKHTLQDVLLTAKHLGMEARDWRDYFQQLQERMRRSSGRA